MAKDAQGWPFCPYCFQKAYDPMGYSNCPKCGRPYPKKDKKNIGDKRP